MQLAKSLVLNLYKRNYIQYLYCLLGSEGDSEVMLCNILELEKELLNKYDMKYNEIECIKKDLNRKVGL